MTLCHVEKPQCKLVFLQPPGSTNPIHGLAVIPNPIPLQAWRGSLGTRRLSLPEFLDSRHMKVVRLSALRNSCLYPPGKIPGTHFCHKLIRTQNHSTPGRIKSMKHFNDNKNSLQKLYQVTGPSETQLAVTFKAGIFRNKRYISNQPTTWLYSPT